MAKTPEQLIVAATQAEQAGQAAQAAQLFREAIQKDPKNAAAWHGLGVVLHQLRTSEEAVFAFQRALSLDPTKPVYYSHFGLLLASLGKRAEAVQMLLKASELDPNDPRPWGQLGWIHFEAREWAKAHEYLYKAHALDNNNPVWLTNLGHACKALGQLDDAAQCFRAAVERNPRDAGARNTLGVFLREQGKLEEAFAAYRQAIELDPKYVAAYINLGNLFVQQQQAAPAAQAYRNALQLGSRDPEVYYQLARCVHTLGEKEETLRLLAEAVRLDPRHTNAVVALAKRLVEAERPAEAAQVLQQGVQVQPDNIELLMETGVLYFDQKQFAEGARWYAQALRRQPESAELLTGLGTCHHYLEQLDQAEQCYRRALAVKPDYVTPLYNLGLVLHEKSQLPEAIAAYDRTIQLQPDHRSSILNRSMAILYSGDWERGWREYENRWLVYPKLPAPGPQWQGEPLQGKTIFVHYEQGFGDTLQFCRYLPMLKSLGAKVLFMVQPALARLLQTCPGADEVFAPQDKSPSYDYHIPLLSLPLVFQTRPNNVPAPIPYLTAEPARVAKWGESLQKLSGVRIGIAWHGSRLDPYDSLERKTRLRTCSVEAFARLAKIPGVTLVSVQKGAGSEQLAGASFRVAKIANFDDDGAFLDTAAIMKHLQLVVSVDTAVIHVAGALGVPVWVPLPYTADWRWLQKREETPWYPTMRLFRQKQPGDWTEVFERMAVALEQQLRAAVKPPHA